MFVPCKIPELTLKDHLDEWHHQNLTPASTSSTATTSMMYGISTASLTDSPILADRTSLQFNATKKIAALEKEIYALQSGKKVFDRVELPGSRQILRPGETQTASKAIDNSDNIARTSDALPTSSTPNNQMTSTLPIPQPSTEPPIHPFSNVRETAYLPPHDRNFAALPSKPAKDNQPSFHTVSPIQNPKITTEVYNRSMKSLLVTLTPEELFTISPDVCNRVRDAIMPKRVATDGNIISTNVLTAPTLSSDSSVANPNDGIVVPDFYETYLKNLPPGVKADVLTVAKESHALRSIMMVVDGKEEIESIIDPGSQIVVMSEEVCHNLGQIYDSDIKVNMQSANGDVDLSLGLAHNVPCRFGTITLYS